MTQLTVYDGFKRVVNQLEKEFEGTLCSEPAMATYFRKLMARLGINKPLEGVEIYTTVVGYNVCARKASTNEPLVEFMRAVDGTGRIVTVAVYKENLFNFLTDLQKEEDKVENKVEYMSFTDALSKMEVGDIIKASNKVATGIIRIEGEYRWYDIQNKRCGHMIALDDKIVNAQYELIPAPKYIDWKTACDALSSGCTIEGHDPEAEHNTTIVITPTANIYQMSQDYPSVGFADLDRYQWIIK